MHAGRIARCSQRLVRAKVIRFYAEAGTPTAPNLVSGGLRTALEQWFERDAHFGTTNDAVYLANVGHDHVSARTLRNAVFGRPESDHGAQMNVEHAAVLSEALAQLLVETEARKKPAAHERALLRALLFRTQIAADKSKFSELADRLIASLEEDTGLGDFQCPERWSNLAFVTCVQILQALASVASTMPFALVERECRCVETAALRLIGEASTNRAGNPMALIYRLSFVSLMDSAQELNEFEACLRRLAEMTRENTEETRSFVLPLIRKIFGSHLAVTEKARLLTQALLDLELADRVRNRAASAHVFLPSSPADAKLNLQLPTQEGVLLLLPRLTSLCLSHSANSSLLQLVHAIFREAPSHTDEDILCAATAMALEGDIALCQKLLNLRHGPHCADDDVVLAMACAKVAPKYKFKVSKNSKDVRKLLRRLKVGLLDPSPSPYDSETRSLLELDDVAAAIVEVYAVMEKYGHAQPSETTAFIENCFDGNRDAFRLTPRFARQVFLLLSQRENSTECIHLLHKACDRVKVPNELAKHWGHILIRSNKKTIQTPHHNDQKGNWSVSMFKREFDKFREPKRPPKEKTASPAWSLWNILTK